MPLPLPNAEDALRLYVAQHAGSFLVLAPDVQNVPTVVAHSPHLLKAVHLSPHEVTNDVMLRNASARLNSPGTPLILCRSSFDGPPLRTGIVFSSFGEEVVPWRAESMIDHGLKVQTYLASLSNGSSSWSTSARMGGPVGYFLTGGSRSFDLWRVVRHDIDLADRWVFTLAPVMLATGLPQVQFAGVSDAGFRAEAEQHWSEFQSHLVGHQYYALVTSAKNVAETLLAYHLSQAGISYRRDYNDMERQDKPG